ncbi:hypothetical protein OH492_29380 [Vibrio chagasii]|nr:hypothetical protein [Vibrio chagasii]
MTETPNLVENLVSMNGPRLVPRSAFSRNIEQYGVRGVLTVVSVTTVANGKVMWLSNEGNAVSKVTTCVGSRLRNKHILPIGHLLLGRQQKRVVTPKHRCSYCR